MSDSFDALLLSSDLAFVFLSYYNTSCDPNACSVAAAFRTDGSLAPVWSQWPTSFVDSAGVTPDGRLLLTLTSRDRTLRVRDAATGVVASSMTWYSGQCDSRAHLALDAAGATAYIACGDSTFGSPHLLAFDIGTRAQLWDVVHKKSVSYWPPPLAIWAGPALLLAVTDGLITAARLGNGSAAWRVAPPPAATQYVLDFAVARELLFLAVAAADAAASVSLLAYNASGTLVAPAFRLPMRVDRFTGSLLADPDGATVYLNGWVDGGAAQPAALALLAARLATDANGAPAWTLAWMAPPAPTGGNAGRYTFFGAQRANGSLVFAGWSGAFQFG